MPANEANQPLNAAEMIGQATATEQADPWRWPKLPGLSRDRINELEGTIDKLHRELATRSVQIADLHNIQQQQATALLAARDAIENLQSSATSLQQTAAQRENETATERRKLQSSMQEKRMLNKKLEDMEKETTDLLQKLLEFSTALNDKEVAFVSAKERVAELEQKLNATNTKDDSTEDEIAQTKTAQGEITQDLIPVLAQAIQNDQKLPCDEANEQNTQFESLLQKIENLLAIEDEQISKLGKANTKLSERCDTLDKSYAQLESQDKNLASRIKKIEGSLAACVGQINRLSEANAEPSERCDTFDKPHPQLASQIKNLENRIRKIEGSLIARDEQINELKETNAMLSERCDELTHDNIILESGHKRAQEKLRLQSSNINLLESALRTGRETAEQKITELTGELQREREVHSVAERESAAIRREIALLLSKLAISPPAIQ